MNPFLEALFQSIAGQPKLQQKLEPAKDQAGLDALINKAFQEALLLPENQVVEGGGHLKAPPGFISLADPKAPRMGAPTYWNNWTENNPNRMLRLGIPAPQIQQAPVSDDEYLELIKRMFSTARPM